MKPKWLKAKIPSGKNYHELKEILRRLKLHTVCEEAKCPNTAECWQSRTATVMIMGDTCTRRCAFCAVKTGSPQVLDPEEPMQVAKAVSELGLRHVVITSVDRDDLSDGGARHFAKTIREVRAQCPSAQIEVLVPDFKGQRDALKTLLEARPDILNHNIETVRSLQAHIRPQASYERSLDVLKFFTSSGCRTKSGLMLGLGETDHEIRDTLQDLKNAGVSIVTIGQYLSPSRQQVPVNRFYKPEEFESWKKYAYSLGFEYVASAPFVRSSYHAGEIFTDTQTN